MPAAVCAADPMMACNTTMAKGTEGPPAVRRDGCSEAEGNFAPQLPPGSRREAPAVDGEHGSGSPADVGDPVPIELGGTSLNTSQDRVAVIMVGLPGCGKTRIAHRLANYLEFFHSVQVHVFNVGKYRREAVGSKSADFFDDDNEEALNQRTTCRNACMQEMLRYLEGGGPAGRAAVFDATNATQERRQWCLDQLRPLGVKVLFIESICNDPELIKRNVIEVTHSSEDYAAMQQSQAVRDFRERCDHYRSVYEEVDVNGAEAHLSYVKIRDLQTYTVHNVRSYLPGKIVQFVLHAHIAPRVIYLTRNGQCEYDASGRIGGDSDLTEAGQEFARRLGRFAKMRICRDQKTGKTVLARLWTSALHRAKATAAHLPHERVRDRDGQLCINMVPKAATNLDDIYAGLCDGMTRAEMSERFPEEFRRRNERPMDNRYPRGESYMDLVQRLEPIVHEFESDEEPLLVVSHRAVLRVLYCYLTGRPREQAPLVDVPLHTVIKLRLHAYGADEERFHLMEMDELGFMPRSCTERPRNSMRLRKGGRPSIDTSDVALADTPAASPAGVAPLAGADTPAALVAVRAKLSCLSLATPFPHRAGA